MRYILYNMLLILLAPAGAGYLLCRRKYRILLRRFNTRVPRFTQERVIWIHGCSVGEVMVARILVNALREKYPEAALLLTVNTVSGNELAKTSITGAQITFAPFDLAVCVRRFLNKARPAILLLLETELWPGLVREARRRGVPVVVVNGRLSPRKLPKYKKYGQLMPPVFSWLDHVAAQEEVYRDRFAALGVPLDRISLTGNMKYDGVLMEVPEPVKAALREAMGYDEQSMVLIFGSTRPGDEVLAAACWKALKPDFPRLRLIVAPRHLNRLDEGLTAFKGESVTLRTEIRAGAGDKTAGVMMLDTLGELGVMYSLGNIAVIGGSFFPGVEGHNPLEPAGLGIPTVFGPFMGNFPDAAAMLLGAGGAFQVQSGDELIALIRSLLTRPESARMVGNIGRNVVIKNQGAVARTLSRIETFL
ncbi:MAG: 3-deoxy-D-manno-octulosonic acid transferase [Candidatus Hydrogenedentes bacterium ADurb.Bin101]|nr:MAG: 3-deoxy-D-manno-octulosonic acid transferase [Candidatus Hydrogenedentes bacterium ADurb.Bin101]HOC70637.1 glycosyltransferase N-terminal domain-containing protein [Candidatus Hydrogenedentota bacterium]HOH29158.1 glycosyltransferase N-terminal domain-containing protein [Candidatus Hydrogenedentota bacterium]